MRGREREEDTSMMVLLIGRRGPFTGRGLATCTSSVYIKEKGETQSNQPTP